MGYPPDRDGVPCQVPANDRTADGVLATWWTVCLVFMQEDCLLDINHYQKLQIWPIKRQDFLSSSTAKLHCESAFLHDLSDQEEPFVGQFSPRSHSDSSKSHQSIILHSLIFFIQ